MVLSNISPRVKKRFPSLQHLVEAGLLEENEKFIMESFNSKFTKYSKHWMPIVWASSIITRARKEGRIRDDFAVKTLIDELNKFRGQTGLLIAYGKFVYLFISKVLNFISLFLLNRYDIDSASVYSSRNTGRLFILFDVSHGPAMDRKQNGSRRSLESNRCLFSYFYDSAGMIGLI